MNMNNTSRLKIYLILATVVIVVVGVVWFYPRNHSSKVPHAAKAVSTGQAKPAPPKSISSSGNTINTAGKKIIFKDENFTITDLGEQVTKIQLHKRGDFSAPYQWALITLCKAKGIEIAQNDLSKLQEYYSQVIDFKLYYENQIATVENVSDTESVIRIPEYTEISKDLLTLLQDKFAEVLGDEKGNEVWAALGGDMNNGSYGFGFNAQTITVDYDASFDVYHIMHNIATPPFVHRSDLKPADLDRYYFFKDKFPPSKN